MMGYVLFGVLTGTLGGAAHLASGGGVLGALGIYSLGGSGAIVASVAYAAVVEGMRERKIASTASGEVRPRAGRVPAARRPAQATRPGARDTLRNAI